MHICGHINVQLVSTSCVSSWNLALATQLKNLSSILMDSEKYGGNMGLSSDFDWPRLKTSKFKTN